MKDIQDIYLTELLDLSLLQRLQDSFSNMTGLAAIVTDANGKPVTGKSNFTSFCSEYVRMSSVGCERCEECDRMGAERTYASGHVQVYPCHAGLVDFSAPIVVGDKIIGCFVGGQALSRKPSEVSVKKISEEIGIDAGILWDAIQEVRIMPEEEIKSAAEFLYEAATIISDIAYGKLMALKAVEDAKKVSDMKSDFLANMSHEIRTPINAVIGMSEIALRDQMPDVTRDYLTQIRNAGLSLVSIVNDVLDFSKIEAGKMDINNDYYDPVSTIQDISNVIMARIQDKKIEFVETINPSFPRKLFGDIARLRQVIINIANNAIKFTDHGYVRFNVDYEKISDDEIKMIITVSDTGIGIKEEDISKIFEAFHQVNSKRNRNIEGTGLGLAITARILRLMGGDITVKSEYGKGSEFTMTLRQKVTDWEKALEIKDKDKKLVMGYWKNINGASHFYEELEKFGVQSLALEELSDYEKIISSLDDNAKSKSITICTDYSNYDDEYIAFINAHPDNQFLVTVDYFSDIKTNKSNVRFLKKPFSTIGLALVLNNKERIVERTTVPTEESFTAPEAKILVVDDSKINLTVAKGLLKPIKAKVTTAVSGFEAIDLIEKEHFDIVFMDHMMPEMDGVDTMLKIRADFPELKDMPIIALTANAVTEAKKMLLEAGMDDFISKPINVKLLKEKVRQWLPENLVIVDNAD